MIVQPLTNPYESRHHTIGNPSFSDKGLFALGAGKIEPVQLVWAALLHGIVARFEIRMDRFQCSSLALPGAFRAMKDAQCIRPGHLSSVIPHVTIIPD